MGSMPADLIGLWWMAAVVAMVTHVPDDALVARCQRGDKHAFGTLVERYADRVYAVCRRWVGDRAIAEEVAQEAFVAAWRALPGFRGDARFHSWLMRIVVNKCRNHHTYRTRRAHGRHDPLVTDDDKPTLQLVHGGPGADASTHRTDASALLERALDRLDEDQRSVLVLRDLEDLTYDEIGEMLGVPRGTVKSRLHRARAALADVLETLAGPEDVF